MSHTALDAHHRRMPHPAPPPAPRSRCTRFSPPRQCLHCSCRRCRCTLRLRCCHLRTLLSPRLQSTSMSHTALDAHHRRMPHPAPPPARRSRCRGSVRRHQYARCSHCRDHRTLPDLPARFRDMMTTRSLGKPGQRQNKRRSGARTVGSLQAYSTQLSRRPIRHSRCRSHRKLRPLEGSVRDILTIHHPRKTRRHPCSAQFGAFLPGRCSTKEPDRPQLRPSLHHSRCPIRRTILESARHSKRKSIPPRPRNAWSPRGTHRAHRCRTARQNPDLPRRFHRHNRCPTRRKSLRSEDFLRHTPRSTRPPHTTWPLPDSPQHLGYPPDRCSRFSIGLSRPPPRLSPHHSRCPTRRTLRGSARHSKRRSLRPGLRNAWSPRGTRRARLCRTARRDPDLPHRSPRHNRCPTRRTLRHFAAQNLSMDATCSQHRPQCPQRTRRRFVRNAAPFRFRSIPRRRHCRSGHRSRCPARRNSLRSEDFLRRTPRSTRPPHTTWPLPDSPQHFGCLPGRCSRFSIGLSRPPPRLSPHHSRCPTRRTLRGPARRSKRRSLRPCLRNAWSPRGTRRARLCRTARRGPDLPHRFPRHNRCPTRRTLHHRVT